MKRTFALTLLLLVLGAVSVSAQVIVPCPVPPPCPLDAPCPTPPPCPQPIVPGVFTDPDWLKVDYHRVTVDVTSQIAATHIDMQFSNTGNALAEGTFLFPLPAGAAVDQLTMWVDGVAVDANILTRDEARQIYNDIVRQYRDPALLEFIDMNTLQANVFPIPPGQSRRIEIAYSQALEVENGLLRYTYPLAARARAIGQFSIRVTVRGNDPISNVYSPSHTIAVTRDADQKGFVAGFEKSDFLPDGDFSVFYALQNDTISVNLLTYRESASDDGFFMLMVQPPFVVDDTQLQPKDVIVVLDQSGSMADYDGEKWAQARDAAIYVLEHLQSVDRFNVVLFSTGWRIYSEGLSPASDAADAVNWLRSQEPAGGTDIEGSLRTALDMVDAARATTVLFLTDGLATEGVTATPDILDSLRARARPNARIFTFGVGVDVDTVLLDSIAREFGGVASYVRPGERVDEEVAALYSKISAPVMTDITIDFGTRTDWVYPTQMPDLFAGTQLTLVGRYRDALDGATITLTGTVNGETRTYVYNSLTYRANAGGEPFIARLWATRRVGDLLTQIRINGESKELVDSIIQLSVRYGIITPYTSFLIDENDILSARGQDAAAQSFNAPSAVSGADAVDLSDTAGALGGASVPQAAPTMTAAGTPAPGTGGGTVSSLPPATGGVPQTGMQIVGGKTFIVQNGVWTDTTFNPDTMTTTTVVFLSDAYFALLDANPGLAQYFAVGERVIVVLDGTAYEVVSQ